MGVDVDRVLGLLKPEFQILEKGRKRQECVWRNQEVDYIPISLGGADVPELRNFPRYNFKEQFYDKQKMLAEQIWHLISTARSKSDSQLAMRANMGAPFLATVFGLEPMVFEDKMPWLKEHLSKGQIQGMEIGDFEHIARLGLMPRTIEYMQYFKEKLGNNAFVYLPDTQGPFDLAHQIRGNEIFTDMHDDPSFVHHLMELTTYVYIECSKVLKQAIGEKTDECYHNNACPYGFYLPNGGVRICEDTTVLLSPNLIREFVIPYTKKSLGAFGGGFIHFCGNGSHLIDLYMEIEEVRGIELGNPELHNYDEVMGKIIKHGKVLCSGWPKRKGEKTKDYFRRMLEPLGGKRKSLILVPHGGENSDWQDKEEIIGLWRSMQEKGF